MATNRTLQRPQRGTVKLIGGLIVRVLCVGSGGKPCPRSRSGGGRGHPGDLVPDGEAVGHLVAPSGGRQQMPTRTETWRDAAERGQERLRMPGRGEPFLRPLALPGRLMRVLGPVVQILRLPVFHRGHHHAVGGPVAGELVDDKHPRHVPQSLERSGGRTSWRPQRFGGTGPGRRGRCRLGRRRARGSGAFRLSG